MLQLSRDSDPTDATGRLIREKQAQIMSVDAMATWEAKSSIVSM